MALKIEIKVVPSSGKLQFSVDRQQRLRCYVKAAAQDGQANYELVKFIAKSCGETQRNVSIIAGLTSRNKIIVIDTQLTYAQFLEKIGIEQQTQIF